MFSAPSFIADFNDEVCSMSRGWRSLSPKHENLRCVPVERAGLQSEGRRGIRKVHAIAAFRARCETYQKSVATILGGPGVSSTIFVHSSTCKFFVGQSLGAFAARTVIRCGDVRNSPAARVPY